VVVADPGAALVVVGPVPSFRPVTAAVGAAGRLPAGRVLTVVIVVGALRRTGRAQVLQAFRHF
jgi:hypothetical protein